MRILQVIHQFPPHSTQGSEVYCRNLAMRLRVTEDVRVFHVSNVPGARRRKLHREVHADMLVYHCIDGGEYARLADWPNEFLRRSFRAVLDEFRPEVVHFHNFVALGDDLPSRARAAGAGIVYTLHDYGLICPNSLLLRDDGVLCGKNDPEFFQDCCPVLIRTDTKRRTPPWTSRFPSLARWRLYALQQPSPGARAALLGAVDRAARWFGEPRTTDVARKREFFLAQSRRIFADVDLFLAPSDFLLRRYVSCGIPREKIVRLRYGLRHFAVPSRDPTRSPIRFGYIGALHPQKGLELLLEAFRGVGDGAELHIHGSVFGSPVSGRYWRRIRSLANGRVFLHGGYDNERVGDVLADLDMVVVPSLWYENSPLTIQEAFIAGAPVITADAGGMAELVRDGVNGLHFRIGDASDLCRVLRTVVDRPEVVDRLRNGIPAVPDIEKHAGEVLSLYGNVVGGRAAPSV